MADVGNSNILQTTGILNVQDACVVLVKTEWNAAIVDELERGCRSVLEPQVKKVITLTVPGAVEIPFAISHFARSGKKVDAFIALGCVIKGDTPHFDYVCKIVADGVLQLNLQGKVPTIFGVLTVDTIRQANERVGGPHGHKGEEAGMTALKMISFTRKRKK